MTLTNTDCVGHNWSWHKVFCHFTWELLDHVKSQVHEQVNVQMYNQVLQINSIRTELRQDIYK
jgi:hypothetical protein